MQGGVGELQTMGLVRVMVEEKDHIEAKAIIDQWDAAQPEQEVPKTIVIKKSGFGTGVIGFF